MAKTAQSPLIPRQRHYRRADMLALFSVDTKTFWRWSQDGLIPPASFYVGRVPYWTVDDVKRWEDGQKQSARAS